MNIPQIRNFSLQRGATLVITLIVLLVLTTIAVALTNSNQTQATMVRNSQFRLEAFNASYTEIDAQIDNINSDDEILEKGYPNYINTLVDGNIEDKVSSEETTVERKIEQLAAPKESYMEASVAQFYHSRCKALGEQIGEGAENIRCERLRIAAETKLKNASIKSDQKQIYEVRMLQE